ncbi:MAG: hypothetical protein OEL55_07595, partial [Desulfobulbaceae bacterium]|nr:hypothetical protein [Desulfobulbaceae bacterium]
KFWYDCTIEVQLDDQTLASSSLKDSIVIKGSTWTGPKAAFERELPEIYKEIIRKMIRDNKDILAALKS